MLIYFKYATKFNLKCHLIDISLKIPKLLIFMLQLSSLDIVPSSFEIQLGCKAIN